MSAASSRPLPVGVLLSGTGRTLENLLQERDAGRLDLDLRCVVSSHPDVRGLEIARAHGIPTAVCRRRDHADARAYGEALGEILHGRGVELVTMAGFLHRWILPPPLVDRVLNIHPALLPAFGGRGLYGMHVHRAVVAAGVKVSGCTVHFADDEYDSGPIVVQRCVHLEEDDLAEQVADKVFREECVAYPQAIRWFAEGRLRREGRRIRVVGDRGD